MKPPTVLVVEDNVPQAESLYLLLGMLGYTPYLAGTVATARGKVETHPPDAVVLDWMLPGGGSLEFLRWLRGRPGTAAVPVLITTGLSGDGDDLKAAAGLGTVAVAVKPCDVAAELAALGVVGAAGG